PHSISGHALESQKIYNFHQVEGYMVTGSEIDELEKVSMQQVNSLRTALESEIAALEAARKRTEEEEERLGKLRHLHEALSKWAADFLKGGSEDVEFRIKRMGEVTGNT